MKKRHAAIYVEDYLHNNMKKKKTQQTSLQFVQVGVTFAILSFQDTAFSAYFC